MKAIHAKRLEKLAEFLATEVPRERFDMYLWADGLALSLKPDCGTSACALGWATVLFPRSLWLVGYEAGIDVVDTGERYGRKAAEAFFGLAPGDADRIFVPHNRCSPKQVARTIRHVVAKDKRARGQHD